MPTRKRAIRLTNRVGQNRERATRRRVPVSRERRSQNLPHRRQSSPLMRRRLNSASIIISVCAKKRHSNGQDIPKVTSVLTLDEMAVTGIFRTPRGYAAMVEAKPIKLSYTIYPGEKFFDGQLVAVEENRLVFRKVIKMSDGKFIASVENKTLRQYSVQEEVQGTAPIQPSSGKVEEASNTAAAPPKDAAVQTITPSVILSPLDEMNRQPVEAPKDAAKEKTDKKGNDKKGKKKDAAKEKTDTKKPVKVAENKDN